MKRKPIPIYSEEIRWIYSQFKKQVAHMKKIGMTGEIKCYTSGVVIIDGKRVRIPEKAFNGIKWAIFVKPVRFVP